MLIVRVDLHIPETREKKNRITYIFKINKDKLDYLFNQLILSTLSNLKNYMWIHIILLLFYQFYSNKYYFL